MRCMNVCGEFAPQHLKNIKLDPLDFDPNPRFMNWIEYIASAPVLAMIVEGDNSVFEEVFELTSKDEHPFCVTGDRQFMPANQEQVQAVLKKDECYELKQDFKDNFSMEKLSVFLITPLAYEEGCVGEVLKAIEGSCLGIRGLILVRRPTDSGSSSEIDGDEYGVAVVASAVKSCLRIKPGNAKMSTIKNEYMTEFRIGSDYLRKIKQGQGPQGLLEATKKYSNMVSVFGDILQMTCCMVVCLRHH
ncbi:uncharacterized protein LOC113289160 isoform X2 [Papaver somniferum]|uniref:uncharacterized protein LOC113289160 isoform X2 n=1 Tax=Papaver somniferum TaxID=3469 RepID=UPI000E6F9272|nr:uncharacterized protein LOC113289160 isoform X2 [Papaver somniferum]